MRPSFRRQVQLCVAVVSTVVIGVMGCASTGDDPTAPPPFGETLSFSAAQISSLHGTAQQIAQSNASDPDLKSLVDSALMVFTVGIQAKRVDVVTDLTTAPLYFVGIHRATSRAHGASSTWTLVALDNPSQLTSVIEVSGFAQDSGSVPPTAVNGTIGDGRGIVNALLLHVGTGGQVQTWHTSTGTASFSSSAAGAACPGFAATPVVSCALETMHVHFTASASSGTGGAGSRQATVASDVDVPAMRLTYTPP